MTKKKSAISVVVPVLNESGTINKFIEHIMTRTTDVNIEIIVADGDETGSTINNIRCKKVITLVSCRGRAAQMNAGAMKAQGNIILFLHADTLLPENAFQMIEKAMENNNYAAGAFDLGIENNRFIFTVISFMSSIKHRLTRVPFGDQGIFIRSSFFEDIGGFKEIPLMEDIELMKRIKKMKKKIIILPAKVYTSPRKWIKDGILYTIFRNWILEILFLCGVSSEKFVSYYYGTGKK